MTIAPDIPIFDFAPHWGNPVQITYEYWTDIFTSRAGREQRRALRQTPRKTVEYSAQMGGDTLRRYDSMLAAYQGSDLLLPDWSRKAATATQANAGSSGVEIPGPPSWAVPGATIVLMDGGRSEACRIESLAGAVATLDHTLAGAWPAGTTVRPGLSGRLSGSLRFRRQTSVAGDVSIDFDVLPTTENYPQPSAAELTYNGNELLAKRPNWAANVDITHEFDTDVLDFRRGPVRYVSPTGFPRRLHRLSFLGRNVAETDAFLDFFIRMRGQRGVFYAPTWQIDMRLAEPFEAETDTIALAGRHYSLLDDDPVYRQLAIITRDGEIIPRGVAELYPVEDTTWLTLDTALPEGLTADDILFISWMPLWRLASDKLTFSWVTDSVSQFEVTMRTLEADAYDVPEIEE